MDAFGRIWQGSKEITNDIISLNSISPIIFIIDPLVNEWFVSSKWHVLKFELNVNSTQAYYTTPSSLYVLVARLQNQHNKSFYIPFENFVVIFILSSLVYLFSLL